MHEAHTLTPALRGEGAEAGKQLFRSSLTMQHVQGQAGVHSEAPAKTEQTGSRRRKTDLKSITLYSIFTKARRHFSGKSKLCVKSHAALTTTGLIMGSFLLKLDNAS